MEDVKPIVEPVAKKPKSHKKTIFIVIAVVIILLIAAVIAYVLTNNSTPKKVEPTKFESLAAIIGSNAGTTSSSATSSSAGSSDQGTGVIPRLIGKVLTPTTTNGMGATTIDGYVAYTLPVYQLPGKTIKTIPTGGQGSGVESDSAMGKANYQKVIDFFNENHFNKVNSASGSGIPTFLSKSHTVKIADYAMYDSSDVICVTWRMDVLDKQPNTTIASVGCADKISYAKAQDVLQPFADGYGTNDTISGLVFGNPVVAKGADGYMNATIYQEVESKNAPVDRFEVLYYQEPNQKKWTFFDVTNGPLSCTTFDTDIVKKAFKGIACYDETADKLSKV